MVHKIQLSKGMGCLIDDEDVQKCAKYTWHAHHTRANDFYAGTNIPRGEGGGYLYLHRFLLGSPEGKLVDHRNRNTLDNRRENLRICDISQNSANSVRTNAIGFTGIYKQRARFRFVVSHQNRIYSAVASFATAREAGLARDVVARQLHGEFATLNFPDIHDYVLTHKIKSRGRYGEP